MDEEEIRTTIRTVLEGRDSGLTFVQLQRECRRMTGAVLPMDNSENTLRAIGFLRTERASWGDTLYFLRREKEEDQDEVPKMEAEEFRKRESGGSEYCRYNPEEEVRKLESDGRGWFTICWNAMPGDSEKDVRERFSPFGPIADIRMDKGMTFVRFCDRRAAETAIKELGAFHLIEASRNPKSVEHSNKAASSDCVSKMANGSSTSGASGPVANRGSPKTIEENPCSPESRPASATDGSSSTSRLDLEIYVSELPLFFSEIDLEEMFLDYDVRKIRTNSSQSRRTAFVEFGSRDEVDRAIHDFELRPKTPIRIQARRSTNANEVKSEATDERAEQPTPSTNGGQLGGESTASKNGSSPSNGVQENSASSRKSCGFELCRHATTPCKKYPNCLPNCDFQHPLCPSGVECLDRFCPYDHRHRSKKCHLCARRSQDLADVHPLITQCDHRRTACTQFPDCPYGLKCSFKHPMCPDGECRVFDACPFEHEAQQKICYICWKTLKEMGALTATGFGASEDKEGKRTSGAAFSLKENIPCRYDAKCWTPQCPYKHPPEWNKRACPWGNHCRREKCTFVHPPLIS